MYKTVTVSQLKPNPYRNIDDYPLSKVKIDKLRQNFKSTGFWGNIVVRPAKDGGFEIAYGHHRLKALHLEYGGKKRIEVIVKKLSNDDLLKMMAQENMEEYGTDAFVEAETVQQTILAAANGEITLPSMGRKIPDSKKRMFESSDSNMGYTALQIAKFLGWTSRDNNNKGVVPDTACKVAFMVLDAIEEGIIKRMQVRGLSRRIAHEIITQAMASKREQERIAKQRAKEAKEAIAKAEAEENTRKKKALEEAAKELERQAESAAESAVDVAKDFAAEQAKAAKSGDASVRSIKEDGADRREELRDPYEQRILDARQYYKSLCTGVSKLLNPTADDKFSGLLDMLSMDCGLEQNDIDELRDEITALGKRSETFNRKLKSWRPKKPSEDAPAILKLIAG